MIDLSVVVPYMFTADKVQYKDEMETSKGVTSKKPLPRQTGLYVPKQRDPLFWCFYIVLHGITQYEQIARKSFVTEKEFKIESVAKVRERADELKAFKIKRNDVEDALVNRPKLSLNAMRALSLVYDVSILYTKSSVYYEFNHGAAANGVIVYEKGRPGVYLDKDVEQYKANIRKGRWYVEDPAKPIKAVSAYSAGDLRDICEQLSIEHDGLKKAEMYQQIREKIDC